MIRFFSQPWPDATELDIDGRMVRVEVKRRANSKHYRLTLSRAGQPVLSAPVYGRWAEAEAFLHRQKNWLAARMNRAPEVIAFVAGARIPLRGELHEIADAGGIRGQVKIEMGEPPLLLVPGGADHMARRLTDWLKKQAHADLEVSVDRHAGRLGVTHKSISLRDQSSRWGSCSSSGRLNFNWRLIMAPGFVLDYVAAHEVAHLIEMNHSHAFWQTVERTLPDMARGRAWLKAHGHDLMRYGR